MPKLRTLFVLLCLAFPLTATAEKPKYGPEATPLSGAHDYFRRTAAPDYWALSPYYLPQQNGRSCSLASATMIVNAARAGRELGADDELATQKGLLARTKNKAWAQAVGAAGRGVTLDELGPWIEQALKTYGVNARVDVVHLSDESAATKSLLHEALIENEKSAGDFLVINFIQGTYTGDADVGHIAPIAAYDAVNKRALVLDPDRQWYEPYWVSEETLLKGMATKDLASGKTRGFVRIRISKS